MKKLKKILLVDDDQVNNYINETLIKELDIAESIIVKNDGESAMEHLLLHCEAKLEESICPELIIFDHHMPIMDGMEMMQALKGKGFVDRNRIVFVLLGVNSSEEHIEQFTKLGVQEYTSKPLSKEKLIEAYFKYFVNDTAGGHTS
jgi:CheY-like chemotaxis protein